MPFPFLALAAAAAPLIGAGIQSASNKRLSRFQNEYNSPVNQMARFKAAGLNPNLVYTQGNPGNMTPITPTNWQDAIGNAPARYAQSELAQTQADVGQQKIDESKTKQALMQAQTDVTNANPYLDPRYLKGVVDNMVNTAKMKEQETTFMTSEQQPSGATTQGQAKMILELNALAEKNNLLQADNKIKAEIFQSQKFQNELREIQVKWLKDGDITPQHILNGIMLLLSKLM